MDIVALRAEIDGTPALAALAAEGQDAAIADALNAVTEAVQVPRRVTVDELLAFIEPGEMPTAGTPERSYLDLILGTRAVTMTADVLAHLVAVFGDGSKTAIALTAAASRPGSRAEELFGQPVTQDDVSACYAEERETVYRGDQAPLDAIKVELDEAIGEYLKSRDQARIDAVSAVEARIKAEHEKRGAVFAENEAPSVLVLGAE